MKGIRFYLEYPNKREKKRATVKNPGNHSGNCIAVLLGNEHLLSDNQRQEAIASVYPCANSAVCFSSVHWDYLRENCKRIPERMAKEIHPNLYNYINQ